MFRNLDVIEVKGTSEITQGEYRNWEDGLGENPKKHEGKSSFQEDLSVQGAVNDFVKISFSSTVEVEPRWQDVKNQGGW